MNKPNSSILILSLLWAFTSATSFGQVTSDTSRVFKNTVRINLSSPMLFGFEYNVIGYERVIKENQSFTVNMGRFSIPKFVNEDSITEYIDINYNNKDKGFNLALDYRFYLKKENKYAAPRGVFLGPYYAYNYFQRENSWSKETPEISGNFNTTMKLNMNMVGVQLGYQFVIRERVTIDLVLAGPGVWFYKIRTDINTSLDPHEETAVFEKINDLLAAKLPGREILIKPGEFQKSGSIRTSSLGYRYVVHLGFRF